jgi:DNA-binding transcriptional ArsR family regulator
VATSRPVLTDTAVLEALAHPVRLDVLGHLMASGPATASACARAVGDNPSNCSYHLRVLARLGLVAAELSADGRERPWRAMITGFDTDDADPDAPHAKGTAALHAAALQLDQRRTREYLARRSRVSAAWRDADTFATYTIRATPAELRELVEQLDELIRPLIAAPDDNATVGAELVQISLQAFPQPRRR